MVRYLTLTPCTSLGEGGFSIEASEGGSEGGSEDEERRESLAVFIAVVR
jgi:hypothetical protein